MTDELRLANERESLDGWLDFYRDNLLWKISDLTPDQLAQRSVPPSTMSLLGVVRHLSGVERYWLITVATGAPDTHIYGPGDEDWDEASAATATADIQIYRDAIAECRSVAATLTDLDGPVVGLRRGQQLNLRWILTHLIEEYARHLGHADLLRECVDGRTGYAGD